MKYTYSKQWNKIKKTGKEMKMKIESIKKT